MTYMQPYIPQSSFYGGLKPRVTATLRLRPQRLGRREPRLRFYSFFFEHAVPLWSQYVLEWEDPEAERGKTGVNKTTKHVDWIVFGRNSEDDKMQRQRQAQFVTFKQMKNKYKNLSAFLILFLNKVPILCFGCLLQGCSTKFWALGTNRLERPSNITWIKRKFVRKAS